MKTIWIQIKVEEMKEFSQKHLKVISSLIKSQPPDVELIPLEGSKLKTWKMLLCLHSRWLAELLESQETSEYITSINIAVGQDDLEMLLETKLDVKSVSIDACPLWLALFVWFRSCVYGADIWCTI